MTMKYKTIAYDSASYSAMPDAYVSIARKATKSSQRLVVW